MFRAVRLLATLGVLAAWSPARAQTRDARFSPQCIDLVKLKSGQTIRGAVVHQEADGALLVAIQRDWLRRASPGLSVKIEKDEADSQHAAWTQLRDRLERELKAAPAESGLAAFLKGEQRRTAELLSRPGGAQGLQFAWLAVPKKNLARLVPAAPDRRRIAGWAWYERLAGVETRSAADLARELSRKGDNVSLPVPDFSDRFPPRLQDDREWAARMAVVGYTLGDSLDFQGTGDLLVRTGSSNNAADLSPIIARIFSQQVDSLLKELLNPEGANARGGAAPHAWLKSALCEADRLRARGFRATRVDLNLNARQATVESAFAAKMPGGGWETIWSDRETQDGSKQRAQSEELITKDPQVSAALKAVKSLGLADDDQFQQAIRFGAATMAAQKAVDARFFAFRDPLVKRLDGPPLWLRGP